jgi:hypothetical protein
MMLIGIIGLTVLPFLGNSQKKISFSYDLSLGDTILEIGTADIIKNCSFECNIYFPDVDSCFDLTFVNTIDDSTYHSLSSRAYPMRIYPSNYPEHYKHDIIRWDEHYGSDKPFVKIENCDNSNTGIVYFDVLFSDATNDAEHAHDVVIQDYTGETINLYMFLNEGIVSLSTPIYVDDRTFNVNAGHSIEVGDIVCFQEGINITQSIVVSININEITVDNPFDRDYSITAGCAYGTYNMAVDGSIENQIFKISPARLQNGQAWDITRIIIIIDDNSSMDDGKFGGANALTYGICFRHKNSKYKNLFNFKKNSDLRINSYDVQYVDATLGPAGLYSLGCRKTNNGDDKQGAVIRLYSEFNDELQAIVQDDASVVTSIKILVQGHFADLSFN